MPNDNSSNNCNAAITNAIREILRERMGETKQKFKLLLPVGWKAIKSDRKKEHSQYTQQYNEKRSK